MFDLALTNARNYLSNCITSINSVQGMRTNMERVEDIIEQPSVPAIPLNENDAEADKIPGSISVSHVSYQYHPGDDFAVSDASFSIKPGEIVAFVGESGCGKSTLLKLLLGLETADTGRISYDSRSLEEINLRSLRKKTATLLQSTALMPGTIYSNIAFNQPGITEEEAWAAAEKACIADDIRKLPLGLYTEISEAESNGFSGGQRQRILLSRVFASKAGVMIFDEATSALDNITQKKVLDAIYQEKATVIMVAHRLSTVVNCDRILMLEKGSIVEAGTYEELMKNDQKFAALVRKQLQE